MRAAVMPPNFILAPALVRPNRSRGIKVDRMAKGVDVRGGKGRRGEGGKERLGRAWVQLR